MFSIDLEKYSEHKTNTAVTKEREEISTPQ
jgi:hypothetical protein